MLKPIRAVIHTLTCTFSYLTFNYRVFIYVVISLFFHFWPTVQNHHHQIEPDSVGQPVKVGTDQDQVSELDTIRSRSCQDLVLDTI